ncbi:ATP-binding protein [Tabrizicola sp. BL-A-41-H6]|uniref:ATP-binding protein n=1 Tax=Tabrizicola sp. BL-A-41-H6 TaxID=3421107 RepID=UPI003D66B4BE
MMNGTSAFSSATQSGERRQLSVLFTDMVGYTSILERLGEDKALPFTRLVYEKLAEAIRLHGGAVRSFAGDSVMAVFGFSERQEDAALRACRAALTIDELFKAEAARFDAEFGVRPVMRVGVSSGTAVIASVEGEASQQTAVGNVVNLASRIQALAPPGGCLVCDATRRLVEWLADLAFDGERELKGVSRPQKLWRLLSVREGATRFDASLARGLSPLVGRDAELASLIDALNRSRQAMAVIDIVAEPGLGKTRLVFETRHRAEADSDRPLVLAGSCIADGQQTPFLPFLEVLRSSFGLRSEDEPETIARKLDTGLQGTGLSTPENHGLLLNLLGLKPPEGTLDGLDGVLIGLRTRDLLPALLRAICKTRRVLLLIEDAHWIDGASEDLLRKLIEGGDQPNLMVIHTRRPEYRPSWEGDPAVITLALKPLGETDIRNLMQTRLGVDTLPDALVRQVTERAGGNPLFGEEVLSFLLQNGALHIDKGQVKFDAARGESGLPASMRNLLSARVDRLARQDRLLLQAAAAIGRRFDPGLLASVAGQPDETGAALHRLQDNDIIYREADSSDYAFRHVLLRDSVYQSLLSDRRAELHLAIAEALEARNHNRLTETAEALAYHYAQTNRADQAFTYAAMAGSKSLGMFSLGEADRYFAAAFALYERDPSCVTETRLAAFLADYALCSNLSLRAKAMEELAAKVRPFFRRQGDSLHHALFLHHLVACLICDAKYLAAIDVRQELSDMAARLGDPVSRAYAIVSEIALSCYCKPFTNAEFDARRVEAEKLLAEIDDAYLQNYFGAHLGWDKICRGRVLEANEAADRMMEVGLRQNDARSLGYGTAMKALTALCTDDYETALAMSEQALKVSRVEFETAIAAASRHASLVPLGKPGAAAEVRRFLDTCATNGWTMFGGGPEIMLGVALAMEGRIGEGLAHMEAVIKRRESEGAQTSANWNRLFLCEVYLGILSGQGGASPAVLLRNIGALTKVILFGPKKIMQLVEQVRAHPHFDADGHYYARTELILGMLHKAKKQKAKAIAHLTEAQRLVAPAGRSTMATRIDLALNELTAA